MTPFGYKVLLYNKNFNSKNGRNDGIRKSSFGNHYTHFFKQKSLDAETGGWKIDAQGHACMVSVLVCWGCHCKIAVTELFKQTLLTVLHTRNSKIKVPTYLAPVHSHFSGFHTTIFLLSSYDQGSMGWEKEMMGKRVGVCLYSFKDTCLTMWSHTLI